MSIQLLDTIYRINPWFKTKSVPPRQLHPFKRKEFSILLNDLNSIDLATLIIGGRRVGKSVLMYQMIDYLLNKGVNPLNILFIQGDNPILREIHDEKKIITDVLDLYQDYILRKKFQELEDDKVYIFIDEAQSLIKWDEYLKAVIDLKYNIKFIVTGSSSFTLRKGAQNPLTGRVNVHIIPPFSFVDFVTFKINGNRKDELKQKLSPLTRAFQDTLLNKDESKTLFTLAEKAELIIKNYNLKTIFDEYLLKGGFPKVVAGEEENDFGKYLRDLLTTTISQDISTSIRDAQAFERLMVILCLTIGSPISYKGLAEKLGVDERSASKYIDHYIETHWAYLSSQFSFHRRADSVKTDKKIYIIDPGVINTLAFKDETDIEQDTQFRGHLVENVVHNHLFFLKQTSGIFQNFIPFWVDGETRREIDFIFEVKKGVIPIEVKTIDSVSEEKMTTIVNFLKEKKSAKFGIITTESVLKFENNILFIPYRALLLLL